MDKDLGFGAVMGRSTRGADRAPEEPSARDCLHRLLADVRESTRATEPLADGRTEDEDIDTAALEPQLDAIAKTYEFRVRYQPSPVDCTYNATFEVFIVPRRSRRVPRDDERQAWGILAVTYDPLDGPGGVMVGPPRWELFAPLPAP